ncbi:MAG TPA: hypothetical protein VIF62_28835 [Labilithrix sp.]
MTRAAFVAIALVFLPPSCAKMLGQKSDPEPLVPPDPPTPVPVTSATTPPVFTADTGPTTPASTQAPSDLQQAQAAADAKNFDKVKTILEKKTRAGRSSDTEARLCLDACVATKDKKCVTAIKAKYPSLGQ